MIVKVLFVNRENEILLQQREEGDWTLFGGHVEQGETNEEAIVREVKEELDYDLSFFTRIEQITDRTWYLAYMEKPLDALTLGEGISFGFFNYEDAQRLPLTENTRGLLERFFAVVAPEQQLASYRDATSAATAAGLT
jgi:8-oxo-dGTP pyrophosphatase MutT (NUDIX family)